MKLVRYEVFIVDNSTQTNLNNRVVDIIDKNNIELINTFITEHKEFIMKVILLESYTYIVVNQSDELSIGLEAFYEAMKKYDITRGDFLSFATLVIKSRLKTFWKSKKGKLVIQNDFDIEKVLDDISLANEEELKDEILTLDEELARFNLNFESLVDVTPKHQDTKKRGIEIGKKCSEDKEIVSYLYQKLHLPITMISRKFNYTIKMIKRSKYLIIVVIVVIKKKLFKIYWYLN